MKIGQITINKKEKTFRLHDSKTHIKIELKINTSVKKFYQVNRVFVLSQKLSSTTKVGEISEVNGCFEAYNMNTKEVEDGGSLFGVATKAFFSELN